MHNIVMSKKDLSKSRKLHLPQCRLVDLDFLQNEEIFTRLKIVIFINFYRQGEETVEV